VTRLASVQRFYVRLRGIADDTLYLADGRPRAIFTAHTQDLLLLDDDELEAFTVRLEAFLHGFGRPWQLVFRLVSANLDAPAAAIEEVAAARTGRLASAGRELAAFLRHLGRTRVLLQPHLYLVVGLDGPARSLRTRVHDRLRPLTAFWPARRRPTPTDDVRRGATAELDELGEALATALDRLGVGWHRLDDAEIADVFGACWSPTRARRTHAPSARPPLAEAGR
jgi:hypothetical protein